ncbi:helix-turn-helix domain-containing protein [Enterococcus sp. AZ007]|uniref:helix-turn-helix domain-containing protein n=1 Tax=Enterococcus sp. AZ007 TaxID=2774839 RepID=UPI003F26C71A
MINLDMFWGSEAAKEIQLLQLLYKNRQFMKVEELSVLLGMDRRSIYKYFNLLQKYPSVENKGSNDLLIYRRGQGYKFTGTKKDFKIMYQQIIQANPFYKFLESLLWTNKVTISTFAYENFISESIVQKRFYDLNLLLQNVGLSIKKKGDSVQLYGDEAKIRFFSVAFFWKTYHGSYWPFPTISQEQCETIAANIFSKNRIAYNDIGLKLTSYVLAVNLLRVRNGCSIDPRKINAINHSSSFDHGLLSIISGMESTLNATIVEELRLNSRLRGPEIKFLLLWFYSNANFYFLNNEIVDYLNKHNGDHNHLLQYLYYLNEILAEKDSRYDKEAIPADKKQLLLSTLLAGHLSVELFGNTSFTVTGYEIEAYIKKKVPKLLERAIKVVTQSKIYTNDPDRLEGLALQFTIAVMLIESPSNFAHKIRIKVETDLPKALELFIANRINDVFKNFYNLEISNKLSYQDADFCISTNYLSETDNPIDTLLIDAQVTALDIITIHNKITQIVDMKES